MVNANNFQVGKDYIITLANSNRLDVRVLEVKTEKILLVDNYLDASNWFSYKDIKESHIK